MDYLKHYDLLIKRAMKNNNIDGVYYENHHIIPKCMGGDDTKTNIVKLTPDNIKLAFAANMMCVGKNRNNKRYAWLRKRTIEAISLSNTGKVPVNKGKKHTNETIEKISTVWKFIFPDGSEEISIGLREFCKKHNLNPSAMCAVNKGKRSNHKGFKCIKLTNITESDNKEYVSKPHTYYVGKPAYNRKKVIIDGVQYDSIKEAQITLNMTYEKVIKLNEISRI